ncbi:MAG: hypothetical protein ABI868_21405 [Acidobacteriota bacterium]
MSNDHDEIIERLKAQAAAAAGRMVVHESEDMAPSLRERFWRQRGRLRNRKHDRAPQGTASGIASAS